MRKALIFVLILILLALAVPAQASTQLFLKNPLSSWNSTYGYASLTRSVLAFGTSVTNTTASGTLIQWTKTGGGTALKWISPPVGVAFTLSGNITVNAWAKEAAAGNNAGIRMDVAKYSGGSEGAAFGTASFGSPTELTTTILAKNWTITPSSTAFAIGDRIVFTGYVINVGTMGSGTPGVTIDYSGPTNAADGDTYATLTENVTFQSEAEFIQFAQQYTASGTSHAVALPGASAAGNLLVIGCGWTTAANNCTITDNNGGGNTYTSIAVKQNWNGTAQTDQFFYAQNIIGGGTITVTQTMSGASTNLSISVIEYGGMAASAFDVTNATVATGSSTTPLSNATGTTNFSNEIIVSLANGNTGTNTAGASYVLRSAATSPTTHSIEDRSVTATGSYTAGLTLGTNQPWIINAAGFKWGTQPAAATCTNRLLLMGIGSGC